MKRIVLIGATGSIGSSTLEVIRRHPGKLKLIGIAADRNTAGLAAIATEFDVKHTCLFQESGVDGLIELATLNDADVVLLAATGTVGLRPALAALAAGKTLALASKEVLVLGGEIVMAAARNGSGQIIPVDSEHNALFQCLNGQPAGRSVQRLILTASGGAFRDWPASALKNVMPSDALQHPTWSMGPKVTVDSATMANKGLELIEARWLFDIPSERLDVVLHPQSIVHGMVEFIDGSHIAQMCPPSMTFAIQHALLYPERAPGGEARLDTSQPLRLDFHPVDLGRYPCLRLAREALTAGGAAPAIFNAANEIAVDQFLQNELPYTAIPEVIEHTLEEVGASDAPDLEGLLNADSEARECALAFTSGLVRGSVR